LGRKRIVANNQAQTRNQVKQEIIKEMKKTFALPQANENTIIYCPQQTIEE
jgi:hypothetical protein